MELKVKNATIRIEFSFLFIVALSIILENNNVLYVLLFSGLHELGHLISLLIMGGRLNSIIFSYYGVGLKYESEFGYVKEFVFLLSGILVNLAFSIADIQREINLSLFVLNSLPIYPLDVGRALKIVLCNVTELDKAEKISNIISRIIFICFTIFAIYSKSFNLILIAVYIFLVNRGFYDKKRS